MRFTREHKISFFQVANHLFEAYDFPVAEPEYFCIVGTCLARKESVEDTKREQKRRCSHRGL
jgi:hypothetical protein